MENKTEFYPLRKGFNDHLGWYQKYDDGAKERKAERRRSNKSAMKLADDLQENQERIQEELLQYSMDFGL